MNDFIGEFIDFMRSNGCAPLDLSEIIADDKRRRFKVDGDRGTQRTGVFQLKVDGEFAVGWVRNYRIGETVSWHSKTPGKKYSPEELKALKTKIEAEKKAAEELKAREAALAAEKAKKLWERAAPATGNEYTARKLITPEGALQSGDLLLVPVRRKHQLVSLQYIAPSGSKTFLKGGETAGGYCALADSGDDFRFILICEGYATGCSLRHATGFPVVVVFNAGNLAAVAKEIKAQRRDSKLIICADNDQWTFRPQSKPAGIEASEIPGNDPRWAEWREGNRCMNTGLDKAREAATKVGGCWIAIPAIPGDDAGKRTDFNDIACSEGIGAVKDQLSAVIKKLSKVEEEQAPSEIEPVFEPSFSGPDLDSPPEWLNDLPPLEEYEQESREVVQLYTGGKREDKNEDWKAKLYLTDKGKIDSGNMRNAELFLENDRVLSDLFCYDEFSNDKVIYQSPPWEDAKRFRPRRIQDYDITHLAIELEKRGIKQPFSTISRILEASIRRKPRNPATEYFNRIRWDGVKRLDSWLATYAGAVFDDPEYVSAVGRKWLCAAVKRVFEPGCKFDYMPVFEGPQGLMKSTMLEELATVHGNRYFDNTVKVSDFGSKDLVPKMQGVLIIELAELSGLSKADVDIVKQEITVRVDRITQKYQNEATEFPRKFVFAGTINPKNGYLSDPTGNRRFWPVQLSGVTPDDKIDLKGLAAVKEQLWAEAKAAVDAGEPLFLPRELEEKAFVAQEKRSSIHPWEPDIQQIVLGMNSLTNNQLWEGLKIDDRTKRSKKAMSEISDIMVRLGYEYKQVRESGERERKWVKKTKVQEIAF